MTDRPSQADGWPGVPELVPRLPHERYAITRRPDRAPRGSPLKHLYGWVVIPANFRVVDPDGKPLILNAADQVYEELGGEFVEVHDGKQEARVACNRYNAVQKVMES